MRAWLERISSEQRDTYLLGLVRVSMAALLLAHVQRLAREYRHGGYFGDFFHLPIVPEALVPSRAVYVAWLVLMALAGVLALIGVRARAALLFVSASCLYVLLCDRLQYHNNRYALLLLGFLLAFTPCDRSFLFAPGEREPGDGARGPAWAQRLMQVQVSLIYLASSSGKLIDRDWREGQVMLLRAVQSLEHLSNLGLHVPAAVVAVLASPLVIGIASKLGIATEMFIGLGVWRPRLRAYALWVGVMFHFGIEVTAHVELFSYLMWTSYILFVTPECRERVLRYRADMPRARALAHSVRALDWLARFRVEAGAAGEVASFCVIDRDGTTATGLSGFARITRAVPLLFPLWLPLHLLTLRTPARALPPVQAK